MISGDCFCLIEQVGFCPSNFRIKPVEDKYYINVLLPKDVDLNKNQRQAIVLRYGEDFSFEEIARSLETTSSNARQLVSRALKRLRKIIKPEDMI